MPDHLGADQRKIKEDKEEDKPIQGLHNFLRLLTEFLYVWNTPFDDLVIYTEFSHNYNGHFKCLKLIVLIDSISDDV